MLERVDVYFHIYRKYGWDACTLVGWVGVGNLICDVLIQSLRNYRLRQHDPFARNMNSSEFWEFYMQDRMTEL